MKNSLVSIVIPVKNASGELQRCLSSIKKQTYRPIEIIVNDDKNSPSKKNEEIVKKFNKKTLIAFYANKNTSMAQARRTGFLASKGKYVLHLDADMTLSRNLIKEAVNTIGRLGNSYAGLIIPERSKAQDFWGKCRALERSCYIGDESIEAARFYRSDIYKKIGYHDDALVYSEDKDVDLRVRDAGYKIGRIKSFITHHEGENKLISQFKKRFYYGTTGERYVRKHPREAIIQANIIFRPAYLRNWKLLAKDPTLTLGMFILRIAELIAFTTGMFYSRISHRKNN